MLAPLLAALVALAGVEPAQAEPAAPVSSVASEALALAKLMAPRDLRIESQLKQFDANFSSALLKDKGVQEVEGKYPGTVDAMAKAVRPLLADETGKIADAAYPKIAGILAAELSGPDIAQLTAYYGSPAGRNLLHQLVESMDASSIYADALKNDGEVSQEAASTETFIAAFKATSQLSAEDYQALRTLKASAVWPKVQAIQPKIQKILMEGTDSPDPAYEKQIEEVMSAAAEAHIRSLADQSKTKAK